MVNNLLEKICKEAVMVLFYVLFLYFSERTDKNYEKSFIEEKIKYL
jgi:hypothetical protein